MEQQCSIGGVAFGLKTQGIDELVRSFTARWPGIDRVQNRPKKQFTGIDDETLQIDGVWAADVHGEYSVPRLRAIAARGNPVVFVLGSGTNLGMWCVVNVQAKSNRIKEGGNLRKIEFTVSLDAFQ